MKRSIPLRGRNTSTHWREHVRYKHTCACFNKLEIPRSVCTSPDTRILTWTSWSQFTLPQCTFIQLKFHIALPTKLHPPNDFPTFSISVTISHLPMPAMCPVYHNLLSVNAVTNIGKGIKYVQRAEICHRAKRFINCLSLSLSLNNALWSGLQPCWTNRANYLSTYSNIIHFRYVKMILRVPCMTCI
jgi:hypothetical protein